MPTPKSSICSLGFLLALLVGGCQHRPTLYSDAIDTVEDKGPLHIAHLKVDAQQWHPPIADCFRVEPGVEWYDTTDTFRIFRERGVSAARMADRRKLSDFSGLSDFDFLLVSAPRGSGVLLRAFHFKHGRVEEIFVKPDNFACEGLYRWLGMLRVVSFPDHAALFIDKNYVGRTPRWLSLSDGEHAVRVEKGATVIAQSRVKVPDEVSVIYQSKNVKQLTGDTTDSDATAGEKVGMATIHVVGILIGVALAILPLILFL